MSSKQSDWQLLSKQIHNELNEIKRDALVSYVIATDEDVKSAQDLYEKLLIDVEMGSCGTTSHIKEAISAVQLYIHRYFMSLETLIFKGDPTLEASEASRKELKHWWTWMKNYRVWEANRKVFLYPENYIRPELRDTKTPAFKTLEEDLLQGEITEASVQRVYKKYLDEYTEVSRLTIAGGYVYGKPGLNSGDRHLVLFGRTKTDPRRYYYRLAEFMEDSVQWEPWLGVNIQIDADRVYPVFAFERIFVFWAKVETTLAEDTQSTALTTTEDGNTQNISSRSQEVYCIKIFYSFYNLNKEWSPAQQLTEQIEESFPVNSVDLFVENSEKLFLSEQKSEHENITISCTYQTTFNVPRLRVIEKIISKDKSHPFFEIYQEEVDSDEIVQAFQLTPELYTKRTAKPKFKNNGRSLFATIFDEPEIDDNRIVMLNTSEKSSDGPWFSFDHKGGSFLCKPDTGSLPADSWPRRIVEDLGKDLGISAKKWEGITQTAGPHGNASAPNGWEHLDAAVQIPEGTTYLFNGTEHIAFKGRTVSEKQLNQSRWGQVRTNIAATGVVDAVLVEGQKTTLFSGNEYLVYSDGLALADDLPQPISTNTVGLPKWDTINAAVQKGNKTYFFNNARQIFVTSDALTEEQPTRTVWGIPKSPTEFTKGLRSGRPIVDAAFVFDRATYLINEKKFVRYSQGNYDFVDAGYPKSQSFYAVLEDLGCQNNQDAYNQERIVAAYSRGLTVHFTTTDRQEQEFKNYQFQVITDEDTQVQTRTVEATGDRDRWTAAFAIGDVTYEFREDKLYLSGSQDPVDLETGINAAFVGTDNQIYLFKIAEYIVFPRARISATKIAREVQQWQKQKKRVKAKWGKVSNNIAETGHVDAAFHRDNKLYLFSGDQYFVYSGNDGQINDGYPKSLPNNQDNFPQWNRVDAVLRTKNGAKTYFFNNESQTFVEAGKLDQPLPTQATWGRVRNQFTEHGTVDAGYATDQHLFLVSGNQFVRYTLPTTGNQRKPGAFIDAGYPKVWPQPFAVGRQRLFWRGVRRLDAIFKVNGNFYGFADSRYFSLDTAQELDTVNRYTYIQGNWGNLPPELRSGVGAALNRGDDLYLFKGGNYIKYQTSEVKPYEVRDSQYEIIRLTSSTAYKLNQTLFAKGLSDLLSLHTQEIDDTPAFQFADQVIASEKLATTIRIQPGKVQAEKLPTSSHLDFNSANGIYYWEIFFHAPFLIAQALNTGQKFETAKTWYEYIFDPTDGQTHWQFLPFQPFGEDIQAIIDRAQAQLDQVAETDRPTGSPLAKTHAINTWLADLAGNLQRDLDLSAADEAYLDSLANLTELQSDLTALTVDIDKAPLIDLTNLVERLSYRYHIRQSRAAQIKTYLSDPFDPHAIAAFRHIAYQKAIVMAYIDNLLDWGDMLFREYTHESINEARMLYILAYELLGPKPEAVSGPPLTEDKNYLQLSAPDGTPPADQPTPLPLKALKDGDDDYDFWIYPSGTPNDSVAQNPYFFVPGNTVFTDYWTRVEDRLYKIRHCLNILGISQPLPLFQPPIDPMALVQAVSGGVGLSAALGSRTIPVPHYRFSFMLRKAQDLVSKLSQFGGELLGTLEKKDAEALSLLQTRQEGVILAMTRSIREAQIQEAATNITALEESLTAANNQVTHYDKLLAEGLTPTESAQIGLMIAGAALMATSAVIKGASGLAWAFPNTTFGVFSTGVTTGAEHVGEAIDKISEALETGGDGISMIGEVLGMYAQHERTVQDWELQLSMANSDVKQITAQIEGAKLQEAMAQRELDILEKEIEHQEAVQTFMKGKFTNAELYQWMASKLSGLYYQTYQMAYDLAKAAEKAFQFERGMPESEVHFIQGVYWDSQRKGLLAGETLSLDLDRMEKAYLDTDNRGFEITKAVSLLEHDPVALLQLKSKGVCEFAFTEAFFDYDFPGHYGRQVKTIAVTFDAGDGPTVMATLTQLSHKTLLEPDPKAVKYLLDPKDQPPLTIRSNWRTSQQIALSHVEEFETNNGLFELRFDDDRYLPFEGTGAVSTWRLELNGKKGSYNVNNLRDVIITLKYTAEQGGKPFADAVKGMLKPYTAFQYFDIANDFPDAWEAFLFSEDNELVLSMTRDLFPNISSSKIIGVFTRYELLEPSAVSMVLNGDEALILQDGKFLPTNGLSISTQGAEWAFVLKGNKTILNNMSLVFSYKASVT